MTLETQSKEKLSYRFLLFFIFVPTNLIRNEIEMTHLKDYFILLIWKRMRTQIHLNIILMWICFTVHMYILITAIAVFHYTQFICNIGA